jgi:autotransporter-associated beta strand protein
MPVHLACSIAIGLWVNAPSLRAAEEVWVGPQTGNWSAPNNWLDGTTPTADPALSLRFLGFGTSPITAANDLGAQFAVNRVQFESDAAQAFTASGNGLLITGISPAIVQAGVGNATLSAPLILDPNPGTNFVIGGNGAGNLTLSGAISEAGGPQSVTIAGEPLSLNTQLITISGVNGTTGGLTLQSGNLSLGPSAIGANGAPLAVKGGSLRFTFADATFTNPIVLHSDLLVVGSFGATLGPISSAVAGTGLTLRTSAPNSLVAAPRLFLTQPSTYTGVTRIDFDPTSLTPNVESGQLWLTQAGTLTGTSLVDLRSGGTLVVEGTPAGGTLDRIPNTTPVELHGGGLLLRARSSTLQVETIGALRVGGHSTVSVDVTSTGTMGQISATSFNRLGQGTVLVRGIPTGASPTPANSRGKVMFATPPGDMVGGGGTGLATSIVPYAIGDASVTGNGNGLVTYTPGVGLRLLENTEYAAGFGNSTSNVRLTTSTTLSQNQTVNALVLAGGSLTGNLAFLPVPSGVVLRAGANPATISQGLGFGARDGKIFTPTNLTIGGNISGTGGLTKSSAGTLTLTANNSFSGPLTINGGLIAFNTASQLGNSTSPIVFDGQDAGLSLTSGTVTLDRPTAIASGIGRLRTLQGSTLVFNGVISGPGGLRLNTFGGGTVRLTANNTFTGPVVASGGTIVINSDAALGAGRDLVLSDSIVQLAGPWTTSRDIRLTSFVGSGPGPSTVNTAGFDAQWNGAIIGSEPLMKVGTGTLTLTAPSPFYEPPPNTGSAQVIVTGGALALAESAILKAAEFDVFGGARLVSDQSGATSISHFNRGSRVTLSGGEFAVEGRQGAIASEQIGALIIDRQQGNIVSLNAAGNSGVKLSTDTLALNDHDLVLRAANLGGRPNDGTFSRFIVTQSGPRGTGFVAGVYVQSESGAPISFATYDPSTDELGAVGFRALQTETAPAIQNPANGGTVAETADFLANTGTLALGARNTINTLTLASAGSVALAPEQTVRLESSSLLNQNGPPAAITGGKLELGNVSGIFAAFGDLTISSALAGSGGARKIGLGTLTLSGPVTLSQPITVSAGTLRAGAESVLATQNVTVEAGATLDLDHGSAPVTLGGLAGNGTVLLGASPLELGGAGTTFAFSGTLQGTALLTLVNGGNAGATRIFSGSTGFSGEIALQSGRLQLLTSSTLGTGTLTIRGGALVATPTLAPLLNRVNLEADLVIDGDPLSSGAVPVTFAASATVAGPHDLLVHHSGGFTLQSAAAHTGETHSFLGAAWPPSAAAGPITLTGAQGALVSTSAIRIAPGSALLLDNSVGFAGAAGGRVPDSAPVFLNSSSLRLDGSQGSASAETIGTLHGAGFNTVTLASSNAQLTAMSLVREERGAFFFRSPSIAPAGNGSGVRFSSSLAGDLVGGAGVGPDVSILPYAIGDTNNATDLPGLITYDATRGVRLLDPNGEYSQSLAAATPTHNVRLTTAQELTGAQTINALSIRGVLSGNGTLTITSGAVLQPDTTAGSRVTTNLAFGAAEAHFSGPGGLTIDGVVSGSGGVTKSGAGILSLMGANTFTGSITINGGNLGFTSMASLGPDTSAIRMNAGTVGTGLFYLGTTPLVFTRDIDLLGGFGTLRAGNGALEVSGTIRGSGALTVIGSRDVKLSGTNTYTGPTILQGLLTIRSDAALGASGGAVEFQNTSALLRLEGPWITERALAISAASQLSLNGNDAIFNGPLEGSSMLTIVGPGSVTLTADSPFNGYLVLYSPLKLTGAGALRNQSIISTSSGSLLLDNAAFASSDRLSDSGKITLGHTFTLIGNAAAVVHERIGILEPGPGVRMIAPGTAPALLDAAAYSYEGGLTIIAGDRLGGTSGGFTRLMFRFPPTLQGRLLPGALAADSSNGVPESFAFYDNSTDNFGFVGVRSLRDNEYVSSNLIRNFAQGGVTPPDADFLANSTVTLGAGTGTVNSLTLRGTAAVSLGPTQTLTIANSMVLVQSDATAIISGGRLNLGTRGYFIVNGSLALSSGLTATTVVKRGAGEMRLTDADAFNGEFQLTEGVLVLDGVLGPGPLLQGGIGTTLTGTGDIQRAVSISGLLAPGESGPGTIKTNNLNLIFGSALAIDLSSPTAFDRVEVTGALTLGGPVTLTLSLLFDPADRVDSFTLFANDGTDPVVLSSSGRFVFGNQSLDEGARFFAESQEFEISYAGGDGNDVVLRAVPEPSSSALLLAASLGLLARRRRNPNPHAAAVVS